MNSITPRIRILRYGVALAGILLVVGAVSLCYRSTGTATFDATRWAMSEPGSLARTIMAHDLLANRNNLRGLHYTEVHQLIGPGEWGDTVPNRNKPFSSASYSLSTVGLTVTYDSAGYVTRATIED